MTAESGARLLRLHMLEQARHELDEVAGAEAAVELPAQNVVPGVLAGAGRARHGEEIGPLGDAAGGAALHRRGADLGVGELAEQLAEAGDLLVIERVEG